MPVTWAHGYLGFSQIYVGRIERGLNAVALSLHVVELILGGIQALLFLPPASAAQASCVLRVVIIAALNVVALTLTLAVGGELLPTKEV